MANDTNSSVATGALSGAAAGTAFAPGVGTAIGAAVGGIAGFMQSKAQEKAAKKRAKELERLRVQNIMKQHGAQIAAEQTALANVKAPKNTGGNNGALYSATNTTGAVSSSTGTSISGNF